MTRYTYDVLQHPDSIRVFELLPGQSGAPIKGKLLEVRKCDQPQYEALSYTWGKPSFPHVITEATLLSNIAVTENLFQALQALRYTDASRVLWIDAVCIDRKDVVEKNRQVSQMSDIYRNSTKVLVWLGNDGYEEGISELERIGRQSDSYGVSMVNSTAEIDYSSTSQESLAKLEKECNFPALKQFFMSEWFDRVWVIQETALAGDILLHAGNRSIDFQCYNAACLVLALMPSWRVLHENLAMNSPLRSLWPELQSRLSFAWDLLSFREEYKARGLKVGPKTRRSLQRMSWASLSPIEEQTDMLDRGLIHFCAMASRRNCTDERDKLYALLAMAPENYGIQPDYDVAARPLWHSLSIRSLLSGDLTILHYAGIPPDGNLRNLSFVADFGRPAETYDKLGGLGAKTQRFHASPTDVPAKVSLSPQGLPKLRGVLVDDVVNAIGFDWVSEGGGTASPKVPQAQFRVTTEVLRDVWSAYQVWSGSKTCAYREGFLTAFARTIIADNTLPSTSGRLGLNSGSQGTTQQLKFRLLLHTFAAEEADGRLFVPDRLIAKSMHGKEGSFTYSLPSTGKENGPEMSFKFPSDKPDIIYKDPADGSLTSFVEITRPLKEVMDHYLEVLSALLRDRCFFVTTNGYIGIGPKALAEFSADDAIVVFEGAETPFALRRIDHDTTIPDTKFMKGDREQLPIYQVVGECYLHGWMAGKAMDKDRSVKRDEFILV